MNRIMRDYYEVFEHYQALRAQLLELLTDSDLAFTPGGENPPLGALCREIGETEYIYIQSFKTLEMDFSYRYDDATAESSISILQAWFEELDDELKEVIAAFSDEELDNKLIDRGPNFRVNPRIQLEIYKEALLIFYGKVSVYLKAMGKERPPQWESWIA